MSNVIIRFKPERGALDQSINEVQQIVETFRETATEAVDEEVERVNSDISGLFTDIRQAKNLTGAEVSRLLALSQRQEALSQEQDRIDIDSINSRTRFRELTEQIALVKGEIEDLTNKTHQLSVEVAQQTSNAQKASAIVSSSLGFLSLIQAITGSTQDIMISTALAVASSTISMATAYGTLALASGNWAMLAAAGAAASSAASIINTLRAVGVRNQQQAEINRRTTQTRKVT